MTAIANFGQQQAGLALSEANLQQQQNALESIVIDDAFVEEQVRQEKLHDWEKAVFDSVGAGHVNDQDPEDLLSEVTKKYLPGPQSTASPMQMFYTVGRMDDPIPWSARQQLKNARAASSSLSPVLQSDSAGPAARSDMEVQMDKSDKVGLRGPPREISPESSFEHNLSAGAGSLLAGVGQWIEDETMYSE